MKTLDLTCRTCNTERSNLVNLASNASGYDGLRLLDIFATVCPSLPINDDDRLPQKICYFCSKQLEIAFKFQLQCKKSHDELTELLETIIKSESPQHEVPLSSPTAKNEQLEHPEDDGEKYNNDGTYSEVGSEYSPTEDLEFLDEEDDMNDSCDFEYFADVSENAPQTLVSIPDPPAENEGSAFMCCHCDKKFYTARGLTLHEKLAHKHLKRVLLKAEVLTIECKYCLQVFERKSELQQHFQHNHKNELASDFTCSFCHKVFSTKIKFERHIIYHSKNRFQCFVKECRKQFVIKYKLSDHMKRFHGISLSSSQMKALTPRRINDL